MREFSDKIMIVDDSVPFLRLCAEGIIDTDDESILEHIIFCENVDDALVQYAIHRPLVVIMDIKMPGKNGIEGAMLLREIDDNAKIFFLSNYPNDPEAAKAVSEHLVMGVMDKDVGNGFISSILAFVVKVAMKVV